MAKVLFEAFVAWNFHRVRVEAELVEEGGMNIGDVVRILGGVEADVIGSAVGYSPLSPPPAIQTLKA